MAETATPTTRQVRVSEDLAEMLTGIIEVQGGNVADLLDPILRPALMERFQSIKPALDTIRATRAAAQAGRVVASKRGGA